MQNGDGWLMTTESMNSTTFQVRVAKKQNEALDICSYELRALNGGEMPPFSAGAHIDVHIKPGLIRQYSLCNSPTERDRYLICVLRDPATRGGSQAMHEEIEENKIITIGPPRNLFQLIPGSHPSLLLAGGIGITPLLAMAWHLHEQGADFNLHYFTRSAERTAFMNAIEYSPLKGHISIWLDNSNEAKPTISDLLKQASPLSHVYTCGPAGFLQHVLDSAKKLDWDSEKTHYEAFVTEMPKDGVEFDVKIRSSGLSVQVQSNETVIAALSKHGINIPVSCEQGICGTCLTRVLDGKPDHKDQFLTDEEHARNDQFTPCCSRSLTSFLLLDI